MGKTNEAKRLAELYRTLRTLAKSLQKHDGWKPEKTVFTAAETQKALGVTKAQLRTMYRVGDILAARAHGDSGRWLFAKCEIDRLRPVLAATRKRELIRSTLTTTKPTTAPELTRAA